MISILWYSVCNFIAGFSPKRRAARLLGHRFRTVGSDRHGMSNFRPFDRDTDYLLPLGVLV